MSTTPILDVVAAFLTEDGWEFAAVEGQSMLEFQFKGDSTTWGCIAQSIEDQHQFAFYSVLPDLVGADHHAAVADLTARINFGLVIGNFEFDMDSGELRYKTSIDVEGAELVPALVKQLVYANLLVTDHYVPALAAAGSGAVGAVEALALVEPS